LVSPQSYFFEVFLVAGELVLIRCPAFEFEVIEDVQKRGGLRLFTAEEPTGFLHASQMMTFTAMTSPISGISEELIEPFVDFLEGFSEDFDATRHVFFTGHPLYSSAMIM